MTGTAINVATVLAGTALGLALRRKTPDRMAHTVVQGVGVFTIFIGMSMALETKDVLVALFSMAIGSAVGTAVDIEGWLERTASRVEARFARGESGTLARGFIASSLLFCVGPMAILGSIQDGLTGDYRLLVTKAIMDGFCSIAFAATLGIGVALSAGVILVYQGTLTLAATGIKAFLSDAAVREMTAVGGLLIVGIGVDMLGIKKIHVANMLPAIAVALLLARVALRA
ncbi:MAG: DUF554 domain-containing protein [Firmicutes bacterium]|nr:DUF554 domain-containing protein [Bacillota bacterium]MDH7495826.1 DUF554 domain-containing protein [Bacillota bacterium]